MKTERTDFILADSGFLIPANVYFVPSDTVDDAPLRILGVLSPNAEPNRQWRKKNNPHTSAIAKDACAGYLADPSFDARLKLCDILVDIFTDCELLDFLSVQATNPWLSATSYAFCESIADESFKDRKGDLFATMPALARINYKPELTASEVNKRLAALSKSSRFTFINWSSLIHWLFENPAKLATFYKYLLLDQY